MRIIIIGGGYLGQLLHTLVPRARVLDWRPSKPEVPARQLGPQYLWEPIPGLHNRVFDVFTAVDGRPATPDSIRQYKVKVGKEQDSSDWRAQFRREMKGFECTLPEDRVEYGHKVLGIDRRNQKLQTSLMQFEYDLVISTIPLFYLLTLCSIRHPNLRYMPIYLWQKPWPVDFNPPYLYVNYIANPGTPVYRETDRDGMRHYESLVPPPEHPDVRVHRLLPGKIYHNAEVPAIREELRAQNILTVGRYGAWNPEELAHETYKSVSKELMLIGV